MATRQPHDAPPGTDAASDQPERDRGPAAPGADAAGPQEQPTERLDRAGPNGAAAADRDGPDPAERPRWVAAPPDPARQPEAHDGAPAEQPSAWGSPAGPSRWGAGSQVPPAGDAPHEPAAAGFAARPGSDGGSAGPSWGGAAGDQGQGRTDGSDQNGPSWGAAAGAGVGWTSGAEDPGRGWGDGSGQKGRSRGGDPTEAGRGWTSGPAEAGPDWGSRSGQGGRSWGSGQGQDGPSWETAPAGSAGWGGDPAQASSYAAPSGRRSFGRTLLALVAAVGLLLTGAGLNRLASDRSAATVGGGDMPAAAPAVPLPAGEEPVAAVARILGPSVVQLEVADGLGSGVIYDKNGYVLTAAHVTDGNQTVTVRLFDGTALPGRVVGSDPGNDIAVVKVDRGGLRPANLALKSNLEVGQMAVAIGSPFGLQQTVTQGVVSAKDRSLPTPDGRVLEVIQTDAPINPGNSGGALADRRGRVIGINDSIRSESGGNEGVGFAIPIDTAVASASHIVKGEPIRTGYLGVSLNTPSLGRAGALVDDVAPGSPAERAGLKVGDLIVKVGNRLIQSSDDLAAEVRLLAPGQNAVLQVLRDGRERTVSVTLGQRPNS